MEFSRIPHFETSLAKLPNELQKQAKITAMDLQLNPANPGHQFHKIDRVRDPNFCTVRVSRDVRIVLYKDKSRLVFCYVGHHDKAYQWAQKRKFEEHPITGGMQLVLVREEVKEIQRFVDVPVPQPTKKTQPLRSVTAQDLLEYGVPEEWVEDVRNADEDQILEIADLLPAEAQEAVLSLATGLRPPKPRTLQAGEDPFHHPDAQRTFRVFGDSEEFRQAMEYPWDQWMVYLHPVQRDLATRHFNGPARVSGSAGTGKTIVAIHRTAHLARQNRDVRVLLTTFSETLANALKVKLKRLLGSEPKLLEQIDVHSMEHWIGRLHGQKFGESRSLEPKQMRQWLTEADQEVGGTGHSPAFLLAEWTDVVDAWQLQQWDEYRVFKRRGRGGPLTEPKRQNLWEVFAKVRERMTKEGVQTNADRLQQLSNWYSEKGQSPYDCIVVDEAQDLSVTQLRMLGVMVGEGENGLFFAGDLGQQIFQFPFSWKSQGVSVQGRSHTLKVNYRTSHQIRMQADRLLDEELHDMDGNEELRKGTVSLFNGPLPAIETFDSEEDEQSRVGAWVKSCLEDGIPAREIGVFVRSGTQISRAIAALNGVGVPNQTLDEKVDPKSKSVSVATMHLAKGLEFRAVVVMACDENVIPDPDRLKLAEGETELSDLYDTERHLLYVACTRAREHLLITGLEPGSDFLDDLNS